MPQSSNLTFSHNIVNLAPAWWSLVMPSRCWINMPKSTRQRNKMFMLGVIDRSVGQIRVSIGVEVTING